MKAINEIIQNADPTMDDLFTAFEAVKNNGDVVAIKLDGERKERHYTLLIMFNPDKRREMLRVDQDDLKFAMRQILKLYIG
jgi:hypothetical protein